MVVVVIAALTAGGYAFAHSQAGSPTTADRSPTVAAFCRSHTSHAGFWSGAPGYVSFLQTAVDAARWSHSQFEAVAGTLCAMLHRLATGHSVRVADPSAPTRPTRQIRQPAVLRAIRQLERLPDAR